jgi:hypothetical protein
MFLLSGVVLTTAPASAATTETVPYTYTVKVPVTKTVWEYQVVKTVVNKRTVYTYQKVAKTKTEYRIETRTGYREAPVKAADKPAAAQYKVQVSPTAAFTNVTKEILVTPSAPGTNKVNLSNQLSGSVGDTTYVRVVAKNAAGKSTPGKVAKLAFGEVSRSNYTVDVPYTATGTRQVTAGYWYSYTDYNSPTYGYVYTQTSPASSGSYWVSGYYSEYYVSGYYYDYWVSGYTDSYWVSGYNETYWVSGYNESYECGSYQYVWLPPRYISKTCKRWVSGYNATRWVSGYREYYYVSGYWATGYQSGYWQSYYVDGYEQSYSNPAVWENVWTHTGYATASAYAQPTYENYTYTAYTTETRVAITNGWKAATN